MEVPRDSTVMGYFLCNTRTRGWYKYRLQKTYLAAVFQNLADIVFKCSVIIARKLQLFTRFVIFRTWTLQWPTTGLRTCRGGRKVIRGRDSGDSRLGIVTVCKARGVGEAFGLFRTRRTFSDRFFDTRICWIEMLHSRDWAKFLIRDRLGWFAGARCWSWWVRGYIFHNCIRMFCSCIWVLGVVSKDRQQSLKLLERVLQRRHVALEWWAGLWVGAMKTEVIDWTRRERRGGFRNSP